MTLDLDNEAQLRKALAQQGDQPALWSALGRLRRLQGDNLEAADCYRRAYQLSGAVIADGFNLGNVLYDLHRYADALDVFENTLQRDPHLQPAMLQRARCLVSLGRLEQARTVYADLLRQDTHNFNAWLELGNVCRKLGHLERALECYDRAVVCRAQDYRGYLAAVRVLEALGQHDAAAIRYHQAVMHCTAQDKSQLLHLYHRMGRFRLDDGQVPLALEALRCAQLLADAANLSDTRSDIDTDVADGLMRLGLNEEAQLLMRGAIPRANQEATLVRLAQTAFRFNEWQISLEALRRNVDVHPASALACFNLAHMLAECSLLEEATLHLNKAEALVTEPLTNATSLRASIAGKTGDADGALHLYSELMEKDDGDHIRSSAAMCSLYSSQFSPPEIAQLHRQLCAPLATDARSRESFANPRTWDRPLRVGLITADFHHQHPVNIFFQPMLARWDHQRFPLVTYFTGSSYDEQTRMAKSRSDVWREITHATEAQVARQVADDQIDILFDLAGHTGQQRLALFARRMAPVQVTFLGYPGSTGCPNIDWLLGDPIVTPPQADHLCSEQVWRLPNTVFCYAPGQDYPFVPPTASALSRPLRFASFNNAAKLTPATIALWARLLNAIPHAQLLLKSPSFGDTLAQQRYAALFAEQGVDKQRLLFEGATPLADMMQAYSAVDIALDPLPYNGGTTTLQAMWMGVPVITLCGGHFVSRMGASFMTAAGLPEWVADNEDDYVAIAQRAASDRLGLMALKRDMRQRLLRQPAWNIDQYMRDFNAALEGMWKDWCLNPQQTPQQMSVSSDSQKQ